ncbi:MAG: isopentenyl phosphate kinase [Euryarchaeota archaeon]|nr:isopentenyl phosphate kinase [Euryarchaeota archaeon]
MIILKLGGSVITFKEKPNTANFGAINRLAIEIKRANVKHLVIVHGGGSYGHITAAKYKLHHGFKRPEQLIGIALTQRAMQELNSYIIKALVLKNVPAVPVQPSACTITANGRIKKMNVDPIKQLLKNNIVPVLYGDIVQDLTRGCAILSGDQVVSYLAPKLRAERVILGSDVDGVFKSDPRINPQAELIKEITPKTFKQIFADIGGSTRTDVTGGMLNKIKELIMLSKRGIESEIVNAGKPNIIKRTLLGERGLGTIIHGD